MGHLAALYCYNMEEFKKAETLYFRSIQIGLKLFGEGFSGLEFDYRGLIHLYKRTSLCLTYFSCYHGYLMVFVLV